MNFSELLIPDCLKTINNPPKKLYYSGNIELLDSRIKIAIVGTRKPTPYTTFFTQTLAKKISQHGGIVISGGALGVDIIAQKIAFPNTIMVSPSSLDIIYPKENADIIQKIYQDALIISEYEKEYTPRNFSFLQRNRLVVGLSDYVIIPQADMLSGSMSSARFAKNFKKPIYVLPQRIDESKGTNSLLQDSLAQGIYDIDRFIEKIFGKKIIQTKDEILDFCQNRPSYEEAFLRYRDIIIQYELEGKIIRENGFLRVNE